MVKQKVRKFAYGSRLLAALVLSIVIVGGTAGLVRADQFDEQIRSLQEQNASNRQTANQLAVQASSYQDAVDRLSLQINSIRQAILDYQHQSDQLQQQIEVQQTELDREKKVLGQNIKTMYLEGQISTLEILAASKDLSEFVDKQQYRNSVQSKVKATYDKITELKLELQQKQREIQSLIKDQQAQQAQLDASLNQQNQLLSYTESQKAGYDSQIKANNSQIAALRAAQLAANNRLGGSVEPGDPGHGGYPAQWDRAPQDSLLDSWGMLNRECVSYTAWKVFEAYGYMPYWGGVGNANQWPANAQAAGIPTGSTPKVGSVAISMGGAFGHSMWVEAVNGNIIRVSQYNFDLAGHYSEMTVNGSGFIYIYFGQ
ncbi:CHAP domain-containing protein [Candidatus Saccharibacteria bacterium]|nr:CHAP domain-containing protein [Candidatus Saccharibacteria bacterium]